MAASTYSGNLTKRLQQDLAGGIPLDSDAGTLADTFMAVARSVRRRQMRALEPLGVNPSQARALRALARAPGPLRSGALSERLRIAARSGTDVIDSLVCAGLATREPDPADRRAVHVALTDDGRELARRIADVQSAASADFFDVLPDQDRQDLRSLLDHLGKEHK